MRQGIVSIMSLKEKRNLCLLVYFNPFSMIVPYGVTEPEPPLLWSVPEPRADFSGRSWPRAGAGPAPALMIGGRKKSSDDLFFCVSSLKACHGPMQSLKPNIFVPPHQIELEPFLPLAAKLYNHLTPICHPRRR